MQASSLAVPVSVTQPAGQPVQPLAEALARCGAGLVGLTELMSLAEGFNAVGAVEAAVALYRAWIASPPQAQAGLAFVANFNLGAALSTQGDGVGAQAAYRAAIAIKPDFFEAHINLGSQLELQSRPAEALACWAWVAQNPGLVLPAQLPLLLRTLNSLGRLHEIERQFPQAEAALARSLQLDPNQPDVLLHWIHLRQKQCTWPVYEPFAGVTEYAMLMATSALGMLAAHDDPALQLLAARNFVQQKLPAVTTPMSAGRRYTHQRLRVAYLSGDLCTHAVGLLLADLFEQHDRSRVELFGFCYSPQDGTSYQRRLQASFEHFERVDGLSDAQAAQRILDCEIDVLVDLQGLSAGTRQGILALRPALVQLTWLGFIGTTAMPWIDAVIADRFALPPSLQPLFSERVLYLDDCFLPGDRQRQVGPALNRSDLGLPEQAFVFASFNNAYKLNPVMFDTWLRVLLAVPGSVLWLLDENPTATANLRAFAAARGIAAERLVFAPRATVANYRAQLPLADLFLDNHPYNAGSTANDVLWAGTPMLTLSGKTFVSRMGGSLLTALGLPELVTHSHLQYEELAISLARNPDRLRGLREHLHRARHLSAAFDMGRLARRMESLYVQAAQSIPGH